MFSSILTPAAILIIWSLIILFWMLIARLSATHKVGMNIMTSPAGGRGRDLNGVISDKANWKAHNFDHLMEQPTIFYAVVFILHLAGGTTQLAIMLAWAYVALRMLHSLWQATINTIPMRFTLYTISTLCLVGLSIMGLVSTLS